MKKTLQLTLLLTAGLISFTVSAMETPTKAITSIEGPMYTDVSVVLSRDPMGGGMFETTSYQVLASAQILIGGRGTQQLMEAIPLSKPDTKVRLIVAAFRDGEINRVTFLYQKDIDKVAGSNLTLVIAADGEATFRVEE